MRSVSVVLVAGVMISTAEAKPLPSGMAVTLKNGKPFLSQLSVSVQLLDNWEPWTDLKVAVSDDDKQLELWSARCGMTLDPEETPRRIPLAVVGAKLANARATALRTKNKYADAARLFEEAWKADPSSPSYATSYLAALARSHQTGEATKLLDGGIAADFTAWFAYRLAVDPDLKALAATEAGKALRAAKPSKLTVKKLGDGAATSPLGVAAIATADSNKNLYVSFVQLKTGSETMRLPIKTSAQIRQVDKLLQVMGFEPAPAKRVTADAARKLAAAAAADVIAAVDLGTDVLYVYRTGGCEAGEYDGHAESTKPAQP